MNRISKLSLRFGKILERIGEDFEEKKFLSLAKHVGIRLRISLKSGIRIRIKKRPGSATLLKSPYKKVSIKK